MKVSYITSFKGTETATQNISLLLKDIIGINIFINKEIKNNYCNFGSYSYNGYNYAKLFLKPIKANTIINKTTLTFIKLLTKNKRIILTKNTYINLIQK